MTDIQPLNSLDLQQLLLARARLQAGDTDAAAATVGALFRKGIRHPDAVGLFAVACRKAGRLPEARRAFEAALSIAPNSADLWNDYANLLDDMGDVEEAMAAFDRAVAANPGHAAAWLNLGIVATAAGFHDRAREALLRTTELAPDTAHSWGALGNAYLAAGDPDAALEPLQEAVKQDPGLVSARHNLAAALRATDQREAALHELDRAIAHGGSASETFTNRAHVLAELGRLDQAVEQYRAVIARHPDNLDAHATLARLLPQTGQAGEALAGYDAALAKRPDNEALWHSAIAAAHDLKQGEALMRYTGEAEFRFGPSDELTILQAIGSGLSGDAQRAVSLLEPLAQRDDAAALSHAAYWTLRTGDPEAAERHAQRATELAPQSQPAWAYLSVIWRLLEDRRETWLADYDNLVMPVSVVPDGADPGQFLTDLETALTALHVTRSHPGDQSLRQGTQTRGHLFDKRTPIIRTLADTIKARVAERLRGLEWDSTHPFLSRNTGRIDFAGSWSVRLHDSGFHISHIHQQGWLSSALHVALPPTLGERGEDGLPSGALTFGKPDGELPFDLAPRRIVTPEPGTLVIFPSYFWHGTVPFRSEQPRLTVAFDGIPS